MNTPRHNWPRLVIPLLAALFVVGCSSSGEPYRADEPWAGDLWSRYADEPPPPGSVRVNIQTIETEVTDRSLAEAALRYRDDTIRVEAGRLGGRNGLRLFAVRDGWAAALRVDRSGVQRRRQQESFLVLTPGHEASLQLVRVTPEPWLVVFTYWGGVGQALTFRQRITGTGMFVLAHSVTQGGVDLELMPYVNAADDGRAIKLTELRTRLRVQPGVPYVIMADRSAEGSAAHGLLYTRREGRITETIGIVMVDVPGGGSDGLP